MPWHCPIPTASCWPSIPPTATSKAISAATTGQDGAIYAIGGSNSGAQSTVYSYKPGTDTIWQTAPALPAARYSLAATTGSDGTIYAIGGISDFDIPNTVYSYKPALSTAPTTTTVSSSANPSVVGQSVTLTATVAVTAPGTGTPSGTVDFKDGSSAISSCGSVSLNSSGIATCSVTYGSTGSHTITAVYSGNSDGVGSPSAAFTQNVDTNLGGFPKLSNGAHNLASVNLAGAYLVGANLTSANFSMADLMGANLTKTNLKGARNMSTATLTGVTWSETTCPDNTLSDKDGGTCLGHL